MPALALLAITSQGSFATGLDLREEKRSGSQNPQ